MKLFSLEIVVTKGNCLAFVGRIYLKKKTSLWQGARGLSFIIITICLKFRIIYKELHTCIVCPGFIIVKNIKKKNLFYTV